MVPLKPFAPKSLNDIFVLIITSKWPTLNLHHLNRCILCAAPNPIPIIFTRIAIHPIWWLVPKISSRCGIQQRQHCTSIQTISSMIQSKLILTINQPSDSVGGIERATRKAPTKVNTSNTLISHLGQRGDQVTNPVTNALPTFGGTFWFRDYFFFRWCGVSVGCWGLRFRIMEKMNLPHYSFTRPRARNCDVWCMVSVVCVWYGGCVVFVIDTWTWDTYSYLLSIPIWVFINADKQNNNHVNRNNYIGISIGTYLYE